MTTAVANPDDFGLPKFFAYSFVLHVLLAAGVAASIIFHLTGQGWGDVGSAGEGAVKVTLTTNSAVAGLPMPTPPAIEDRKMFDPTHSLYNETPQPKPPEPPKEVEKIPKRDLEKPRPIERKSPIKDKTPPPPNTINQYGGTPKYNTGYAQTPSTTQANGPIFQTQGGGDFAGRYPAYVAAMIRRISQNWNQASIDPAARASRTIKATATFTIMRDGTVKDIRITDSSRNSSFDNSGLRALYDSNPMPALPSDYNGSYLSVTFDFLPPGTR
jgi:TonB family protein